VNANDWHGDSIQWGVPPSGFFRARLAGESRHGPTSERLLPGFRYPIADLFKEWDWE
jgi:hypothetical protein